MNIWWGDRSKRAISGLLTVVIPAKAGIHFSLGNSAIWIPACAGMTREGGTQCSIEERKEHGLLLITLHQGLPVFFFEVITGVFALFFEQRAIQSAQV